MKAIRDFYEKKYKLLLIIPILLLLLSIGQILYQYNTTGDFVNRGISLKGGSTITIYLENQNEVELSDHLQSSFPQSEINVRTLTKAGANKGLIVDSDAQSTEEITGLLQAIKQKIPMQQNDYSTDITGSALGNSFFKETTKSLLYAFILMALVVFVYFRTPIPSAAVVAAAVSDIIITLAIFNLTGIKLSTAGVAAFLMLVGYSVDTDILLTTRVIKRSKGTPFERVLGAMKTGLTMTFTTLTVVITVFFLTQSEVIKQIMLIVFIGLLVDIIATWIQNVAILRWYVERKTKWIKQKESYSIGESS